MISSPGMVELLEICLGSNVVIQPVGGNIGAREEKALRLVSDEISYLLDQVTP